MKKNLDIYYLQEKCPRTTTASVKLFYFDFTSPTHSPASSHHKRNRKRRRRRFKGLDARWISKNSAYRPFYAIRIVCILWIRRRRRGDQIKSYLRTVVGPELHTHAIIYYTYDVEKTDVKN